MPARLLAAPALLLLLLLLLPPLAGCGGEELEVYSDEAQHGTVDASLPEEQQAKQDALLRLLTLLQRGVPVEQLPDEVEDVTLTEDGQSFLDRGAALARWDFDGPPRGDDVPVVLHLLLDEPGYPTYESKRVYSVTERRGRFTVERKE